MSIDRPPKALIAASRLGRTVRKRSVLIGILLGVARFFNLLGLCLLVAWSYSWWGSPESPLKYLLWPGVILFLVGLGFRITVDMMLRALQRALRLDHRRNVLRKKKRLVDPTAEEPSR